MDEIMERAMLEGEILGWFDWMRPKKRSATSQIANLNREIRELLQKVKLKKAQASALYRRARATTRRPPLTVERATARIEAERRRRAATKRRVSVPRKAGGLTSAERRELARRMRWGWAQRPGAPDMPGEAAAKRRSYAAYKRNLQAKITARLKRERNMGWAKRPGAPDMPGEAAAKMRRYGVRLGDDTLDALDEELFL